MPWSKLAVVVAPAALVLAVTVQGEQRSGNFQSLQEASGIQSGVGLSAHQSSDVVKSGEGSTAPLTEDGYQRVASLKSDEEMKIFVHRLVEEEARSIKSEGDLSGLVPFYSGSKGSQSFEALQKELKAVPWLYDGPGRTAPLDEDGYREVAKLKSNSHMTAFLKRLLDAGGLQVQDEGSLSGFIPYFSGQLAVQNFETLRLEALSAPWVTHADGLEQTRQQVSFDQQSSDTAKSQNSAEEEEASSVPTKTVETTVSEQLASPEKKSFWSVAGMVKSLFGRGRQQKMEQKPEVKPKKAVLLSKVSEVRREADADGESPEILDKQLGDLERKMEPGRLDRDINELEKKMKNIIASTPKSSKNAPHKSEIAKKKPESDTPKTKSASQVPEFSKENHNGEHQEPPSKKPEPPKQAAAEAHKVPAKETHVPEKKAMHVTKVETKPTVFVAETKGKKVDAASTLSHDLLTTDSTSGAVSTKSDMRLQELERKMEPGKIDREIADLEKKMIMATKASSKEAEKTLTKEDKSTHPAAPVHNKTNLTMTDAKKHNGDEKQVGKSENKTGSKQDKDVKGSDSTPPAATTRSQVLKKKEVNPQAGDSEKKIGSKLDKEIAELEHHMNLEKSQVMKKSDAGVHTNSTKIEPNKQVGNSEKKVEAKLDKEIAELEHRMANDTVTAFNKSQHSKKIEKDAHEVEAAKKISPRADEFEKHRKDERGKQLSNRSSSQDERNPAEEKKSQKQPNDLTTAAEELMNSLHVEEKKKQETTEEKHPSSTTGNAEMKKPSTEKERIENMETKKHSKEEQKGEQRKLQEEKIREREIKFYNQLSDPVTAVDEKKHVTEKGKKSTGGSSQTEEGKPAQEKMLQKHPSDPAAPVEGALKNFRAETKQEHEITTESMKQLKTGPAAMAATKEIHLQGKTSEKHASDPVAVGQNQAKTRNDNVGKVRETEKKHSEQKQASKEAIAAGEMSHDKEKHAQEKHKWQKHPGGFTTAANPVEKIQMVASKHEKTNQPKKEIAKSSLDHEIDDLEKKMKDKVISKVKSSSNVAAHGPEHSKKAGDPPHKSEFAKKAKIETISQVKSSSNVAMHRSEHSKKAGDPPHKSELAKKSKMEAHQAKKDWQKHESKSTHPTKPEGKTKNAHQHAKDVKMAPGIFEREIADLLNSLMEKKGASSVSSKAKPPSPLPAKKSVHATNAHPKSPLHGEPTKQVQGDVHKDKSLKVADEHKATEKTKWQKPQNNKYAKESNPNTGSEKSHEPSAKNSGAQKAHQKSEWLRGVLDDTVEEDLKKLDKIVKKEDDERSRGKKYSHGENKRGKKADSRPVPDSLQSVLDDAIEEDLAKLDAIVKEEDFGMLRSKKDHEAAANHKKTRALDQVTAALDEVTDALDKQQKLAQVSRNVDETDVDLGVLRAKQLKDQKTAAHHHKEKTIDKVTAALDEVTNALDKQQKLAQVTKTLNEAEEDFSTLKSKSLTKQRAADEAVRHKKRTQALDEVSAALDEVTSALHKQQKIKEVQKRSEVTKTLNDATAALDGVTTALQKKDVTEAFDGVSTALDEVNTALEVVDEELIAKDKVMEKNDKEQYEENIHVPMPEELESTLSDLVELDDVDNSDGQDQEMGSSISTLVDEAVEEEVSEQEQAEHDQQQDEQTDEYDALVGDVVEEEAGRVEEDERILNIVEQAVEEDLSENEKHMGELERLKGLVGEVVEETVAATKEGAVVASSDKKNNILKKTAAADAAKKSAESNRVAAIVDQVVDEDVTSKEKHNGELEHMQNLASIAVEEYVHSRSSEVKQDNTQLEALVHDIVEAHLVASEFAEEKAIKAAAQAVPAKEASKRAENESAIAKEVDAGSSNQSGHSTKKHEHDAALAKDAVSKMRERTKMRELVGEIVDDDLHERETASAVRSMSNKSDRHSQFYVKPKLCETWCSSELFVEMSGHAAVSLTEERCSSSSCDGCSSCKTHSMSHSSSNEPTCQGWCQSDELSAVKLGVTTKHNFAWNTKCGWTSCSTCSSCKAVEEMDGEDYE